MSVGADVKLRSIDPENKPYSISEVMLLTGWSRPTVIRRFEREKDVLIINHPEKMHKRGRRHFRIPRHVYRRVVRAHGSDDLQSYTPPGTEMSKQEKFLWAVQTVILANARSDSQPERPRKYPQLALDSGVAIIARKALTVSERIPPGMTGGEAATEFCLLLLNDAKGRTEPLPSWLRGPY